MTQIVALLTLDYVMLGSDRLLTWQGGPRSGKVFKDEECKLVAVYNQTFIGYNGLARLDGRPTHEWIGTTLAKANCRRAKNAVDALVASAPEAVSKVARHLRTLSFFAAGWDWFRDPPLLLTQRPILLENRRIEHTKLPSARRHQVDRKGPV